MGLFSNLLTSRTKKLHRKIDVAIDQVKHGTYNFLFLRYLDKFVDKFDRDFSGSLAAAVTNALFSEKPVGKEAELFLEKNREIVNQELMALKGDQFIGSLVADAVQTKAVLIFKSQSSGAYDHNFGKAHETLRKLDFLKKQQDISTPKLFMTKADKYFRESLKKVKFL
ncbi:MAG: hypothetical protein M0Z56_06205 [Desulfobacteraceae bacterium]|nr:hypothetical protein [Desulfobacteraceae bacterium]